MNAAEFTRVWIATALIVICAHPSLAQTDEGSGFGALVGVSSTNGGIGFAASGAIRYGVDRMFGFELDIAEVFGFTPAFAANEETGHEDPRARATVFTLNLRVRSKKTIRRATPYLIAGVGLGTVTDSITIVSAPLTGSPGPANARPSYPASVGTTVTALTMGGGVEIPRSAHFSIDIDGRYVKLWVIATSRSDDSAGELGTVSDFRDQPPMKVVGCGVDFGTTNSAVAFVDRDGTPRLAQFATEQGPRPTFPSVLYFEPKGPSAAGSAAIERYLAAETKGRFIQSLKAYLADTTFEGTGIGSQLFTLEKLIALIVKHMLDELGLATSGTGPAPRRIVLGRPVHFSNPPDAELDAFAANRLLEAVRLVGFDEIVFEYEPVAAAYAYEARLERDARILIGDFGGGTSDFTIISIGPGVRARGRRPSDIIGTDGVPIAGDAFDKQIIRNLVAPRLGMGGEYLSPPKKFLPIPSWPYERLERWHYLSFLKMPPTIEMLERIKRTASTPERLEAFLVLIKRDLGFQLHQAVQRTKFELSHADTALFSFESGPVTIRKTITRADFERWIDQEIGAMAACVDRLMQASGLGFADIDRVFLTGGSSFVPAVRRIFTERFGDEKVTGGEELTSVATGLALRAAEI